jgi:hypothetical protein
VRRDSAVQTPSRSYLPIYAHSSKVTVELPLTTRYSSARLTYSLVYIEKYLYINNWVYLTQLMLSAYTGLSTLEQSLALSYSIYISLAIINSLIVRLIGYIARFFLLVYLRLDILLTQ